MSERKLPLSRFKVVDLTAHRAGPTAVRILADWGADSVKIEPPPAINKDKGGIIGARHGFDLQNLHRNKRSLTLNLKDPAGQQIILIELPGKPVNSSLVLSEFPYFPVVQRT